jgi:glycosyltransferase involved in cell wall biosynthesis
VKSVFCISEHGKRYLEGNYTKVNPEMKVLRLGTARNSQAMEDNPDVFEIVSCARMIKLKRISMIPDILRHLTFPVRWTHFGDGEEMEIVQANCNSLPNNIKYELKGWMEADEIPKYYAANYFSLFLSISESEGVPVSIMEALAAGIPVLSTDVGGINEIIDQHVGRMVSSDVSPREIAKVIADLNNMSKEQKIEMRMNAVRRFEERCNQEVWNATLVKNLKL